MKVFLNSKQLPVLPQESVLESLGVPEGIGLPEMQIAQGFPFELADRIQKALTEFPPPLMKLFVEAGYPIILSESLSGAYLAFTGKSLTAVRAWEVDRHAAAFMEPGDEDSFTPYLGVSCHEKLQQNLHAYVYHELGHALLQIVEHFDDSDQVIAAYEKDGRFQSGYFFNKGAADNPFTENEQVIQRLFFPSIENKVFRLEHLGPRERAEVMERYRAQMEEFHRPEVILYRSIAHGRREAAADVLACLCGASLYGTMVYHIQDPYFMIRSFPELTKLICEKFDINV